MVDRVAGTDARRQGADDSLSAVSPLRDAMKLQRLLRYTRYPDGPKEGQLFLKFSEYMLKKKLEASAAPPDNEDDSFPTSIVCCEPGALAEAVDGSAAAEPRPFQPACFLAGYQASWSIWESLC